MEALPLHVMTLGAYYQCFQNRIATEYVLSNFRNHHPDSPIILVSDGGDDFSDLARKYHCTYFWRPNIKSCRGKALAYNYDNWMLWWNDFRKYVGMLDTDYMIFLEDDVAVRKPISLDQLLYDVNGISLTMSLARFDLKGISKNRSMVGAQGGAVFRMKFLRTLFVSSETDVTFAKYRREMKSSSLKGKWCTDILLSILTWRHGGTMGDWFGYCRMTDSDYVTRISNNNIEVLHLYKELYPNK